MSSGREARLRPDFADKYPFLTPGVWESAAIQTDRIVAHILRRSEGRLITGERALDPEHFEFRGGEARPTATRPPRRGDHAI